MVETVKILGLEFKALSAANERKNGKRLCLSRAWVRSNPDAFLLIPDQVKAEFLAKSFTELLKITYLGRQPYLLLQHLASFEALTLSAEEIANRLNTESVHSVVTSVTTVNKAFSEAGFIEPVRLEKNGEQRKYGLFTEAPDTVTIGCLRLTPAACTVQIVNPESLSEISKPFEIGESQFLVLHNLLNSEEIVNASGIATFFSDRASDHIDSNAIIYRLRKYLSNNNLRKYIIVPGLEDLDLSWCIESSRGRNGGHRISPEFYNLNFDSHVRVFRLLDLG